MERRKRWEIWVNEDSTEGTVFAAEIPRDRKRKLSTDTDGNKMHRVEVYKGLYREAVKRLQQWQMYTGD